MSLALSDEEKHARTSQLKAAGLESVFFRSVSEMQTRLSECEFLLMGRPPRTNWSRATNLRLLQIAGSGVDPLFPAPGLRPDVAIACCRGAHADAVRDHAIALLLSLARDLPEYLRRQERGQWHPGAAPALRDRHLVLVGLGEIGRRVAEVARALGMRITAVRRTAEPSPFVDAVVGPRVLHDALRHADYVILCAPLTDATRGFFDRAAFAALPPHAAIVNVSRGGVLDEDALVDALRSNRLRCAALDVFASEPLTSDHRLWTTPGLLVTPHVAGWTPEYVASVFGVFIDNVHRVRRGEPPTAPVSREAQY